MMSEGRSDHEPDFETKKWESEFALREREVKLKETDTALKLKEAERSRYASPLVLAIIATALAAGGNAFVAWYNSAAQNKLEDQKAVECNNRTT
jgi:hypothetical protein